MALALIPMENIKEAMDIIISEIDSNSNIAIKQADFVVYFVNQWLNAKKSKQGPEIWNQHQATIKTNNVSEANHSSMPSTIPRHNPLVCQIIKYFKECDSVSSDKFLKLKNNFSASQMRSSNHKKTLTISWLYLMKSFLSTCLQLLWKSTQIVSKYTLKKFVIK